MDPEQMLAKYTPEARRAEPLSSLHVPITVFLGEAVDASGFAKKYWQPTLAGNGDVLRPGLSQVNAGTNVRLATDIASQIDELVAAATAAHQRYTFAVEPEGQHPMQEAEQVLSELTAALEYLFDDGEETAEDQALLRLGELHAEPTSHDAMALALQDYAALARPHRGLLDGLGGFDVGLIDRAGQLAEALRLRSAPSTPANAEEALQLRNQVFALLDQRIKEVRRNANFVFRSHPEIARLAASTYQRRQRAALRRKKETEGAGDGQTAQA